MSLLHLIVLFVMLLFLWTRRKLYKLSFQLPGPYGLPLIGIGWKIRSGDRLMDCLSECKQKYDSPFVCWLGPRCLLIVSDPESVKTILTSENCINKSYIYKFLAYAIGKGSFTSNVPIWNERNKILKPVFHKKILSSYLNIFNKECDTLSENIIDSDGSNIFELFKKYTLDVACQTTIGVEINLQNNEFKEIVEAVSKAAEAVAERVYKPWYYLHFMYKLSPSFKDDEKNIMVLRNFVEKIMEKKKKQISAKNNKTTKNSTIFEESDSDIVKSKDIFIDHMSKFVENGQLSWTNVMEESFVIIVAAFETTSITLYLTFLCIAMHPEYQERLYQELVDMFPDPNFEISDKDLLSMTYLEMIINESMRLLAPVPAVGRVTMEDIPLCNDIIVPKGVDIAIDIFNLHRDTKYWGPNAHKFNPDNFLPENVSKRPAYAFIPFTKGLRMCIGYKYAMNLLKVVLAKVFRNYKVSTETRFEDLVLIANISMKLKKYPTFQIERR